MADISYSYACMPADQKHDTQWPSACCITCHANTTQQTANNKQQQSTNNKQQTISNIQLATAELLPWQSHTPPRSCRRLQPRLHQCSWRLVAQLRRRRRLHGHRRSHLQRSSQLQRRQVPDLVALCRCCRRLPRRCPRIDL